MDTENNFLAIRTAGLIGDTVMVFPAMVCEAAHKAHASHTTLWALRNHCHRQSRRPSS